MPKAKYPARKCLNPKCPIGTFIPRRSDAKYCDNVCRSGYHYELNKENNKHKYRDAQIAKNADKSLAQLYNSLQNQKKEFVTNEILQSHSISLDTSVVTDIDPKSNVRIYWFYDYGVMAVAWEKFKIVKKSNYYKKENKNG